MENSTTMKTTKDLQLKHTHVCWESGIVDIFFSDGSSKTFTFNQIASHMLSRFLLIAEQQPAIIKQLN